MSIDEAIKHAEEVAIEQDKLCKRYDDASGYSRSHNEAIRTTEAKKCEECAAEHRQLAEWLKDYKRLLEQEPRYNSIKTELKPCDDAISRQAAIDAAIDGADKWDGGFNREREKCIREEIEKLPSVTPQTKMGRWSHDGSHWENRFICSECGYKLFDEQTAYCPNCGAKMQEVEE